MTSGRYRSWVQLDARICYCLKLDSLICDCLKQWCCMLSVKVREESLLWRYSAHKNEKAKRGRALGASLRLDAFACPLGALQVKQRLGAGEISQLLPRPLTIGPRGLRVLLGPRLVGTTIICVAGGAVCIEQQPPREEAQWPALGMCAPLVRDSANCAVPVAPTVGLELALALVKTDNPAPDLHLYGCRHHDAWWGLRASACASRTVLRSVAGKDVIGRVVRRAVSRETRVVSRK